MIIVNFVMYLHCHCIVSLQQFGCTSFIKAYLILSLSLLFDMAYCVLLPPD